MTSWCSTLNLKFILCSLSPYLIFFSNEKSPTDVSLGAIVPVSRGIACTAAALTLINMKKRFVFIAIFRHGDGPQPGTGVCARRTKWALICIDSILFWWRLSHLLPHQCIQSACSGDGLILIKLSHCSMLDNVVPISISGYTFPSAAAPKGLDLRTKSGTNGVKRLSAAFQSFHPDRILLHIRTWINARRISRERNEEKKKQKKGQRNNETGDRKKGMPNGWRN